jgi:23S rRNA pseudouridine1911/1915/1917 synthase
MNTKTFIEITASETGQRLDKCLTARLPEFSRSRIQQLLVQACVTAGGITITDANLKVKPGDIFVVDIPPAVPMTVSASDIPLTIVFEDKHLLVIDKPAGMTVHPAPGHHDDTLVNALLAHCGDSLSGIGGVMRPGIVHRIDKDTSGLLVVAKHDSAHRHLAAQLAERTLKRQYIAIVRGMPKPLSGTIDAAIARSPANRQKMTVVKSGGRPSVTHYKTEEIFENAALVRCKLETGRTHQIRVHLTHIGYPIIGDPVYGGRGKVIAFPRQALHAANLTLIHPETGEEMEFSSPIPQDMQELLIKLRGA